MLEYCNIGSGKFTIFLINLSQIVYMIIIVKNYKRKKKIFMTARQNFKLIKLLILIMIVNVLYFI